jgi:hypothetical protein
MLVVLKHADKARQARRRVEVAGFFDQQLQAESQLNPNQSLLLAIQNPTRLVYIANNARHKRIDPAS